VPRLTLWLSVVRRALLRLTFASSIAACMVSAPGVARAAEPPTVFGHGSIASFIQGWNALDNQAWWGAQDFHSKAKVFVSFNTTPSNLGIPVTHMLILGVLPNGQGTLGVWPATFTKTDNPPSISSQVASVTWVPSMKAYHLIVDMPGTFVFTPTAGPFTANLWFKGRPGGAAMPTDWDGQTSFLPQSIGTGTANGTVAFPGFAPITVHNWGADAEPEYGTYLDGTEPDNPANHIGYEWAESHNPDGSADLLMAFAEEDHVWRGILSHTTAAGKVTECEPNVALSDWSTATSQEPANVTGFNYPQVISASCAAPPHTAKPCLTLTLHTSPSDTQIGPFPAYSFTVAMSSAFSSVPGSVAWVQTFREKGSFGPGPTWSSTGLKHPACVGATGAPRAKRKGKHKRKRHERAVRSRR
jgi:hypothetical protein